MRKACIKKQWTKDQAKMYKGIVLTPQTFDSVKNWKDVEVSGIAYFVEKAVKLGAKKGKADPEPKKED